MSMSRYLDVNFLSRCFVVFIATCHPISKIYHSISKKILSTNRCKKRHWLKPHTPHTTWLYIADIKFCTVFICKHGQARTKVVLKENPFPTNSFCDLLVGILVDLTRSINKINDHRGVNIVNVKSGPAFYLLGPAQRLVNSGFHEG